MEVNEAIEKINTIKTKTFFGFVNNRNGSKMTISVFPSIKSKKLTSSKYPKIICAELEVTKQKNRRAKCKVQFHLFRTKMNRRESQV